MDKVYVGLLDGFHADEWISVGRDRNEAIGLLRRVVEKYRVQSTWADWKDEVDVIEMPIGSVSRGGELVNLD